MNNPKVYVGTWAKYNNGSIAGGWISLRDCKDYKQFLSKCRQLHKGEHDPEYMIQDYECFPDGLSCGDWLSEEDFNDIKQAMVEEEQAEQAAKASMPTDLLVEALLALKGGKSAPNYKQMLEEFAKTKKDSDYYRKEYVGAVMLRGKYYLIEKPSIESTFWFHDEGPNYDFYCELMADKEKRLTEYFKGENLASFDRYIDHIENDKEYSDKRIWLENCYDDGRISVTMTNRYGEDNLSLCTDEERAIVLQALKYGREQLEKRLNAYLKRYGTSKIRTGTYWADR